MITKVILPKLSANMTKGKIGKWLKKESEKVEEGEPIVEIVTDKAVFEIEAETSGVLRKIISSENSEVSILKTIALIGKADEKLPDLANLDKPIIQEKPVPSSPSSKPVILRPAEISKEKILASPLAKKLAQEHQVDLSKIKGTGPNGRITRDDVENYLKSAREKTKVLIIGGGDGAQVVIDILSHDSTKEIIGIVDDKESLLGQEIDGIRVLGRIDSIEKLKEEDKFDGLIISFSRDMNKRREIFERYKKMGISFINIIHHSAIIDGGAQIGEGNLIYAFVHIGTKAQVGNNNLISAHSNIEHHNKIGSHNLFAPHFSTSGAVKIGDSCKFGIGVFIKDSLKIGNRVWAASGSTIFIDIPDNSVVRVKFKKPFYESR